jgi:hypothetical protein
MSSKQEDSKRLALEKILRHLVNQHGKQKVKAALASLEGQQPELRAYKWHGQKRKHCTDCGCGPIYGFRVYRGNVLMSHCCLDCADSMEGVIFEHGMHERGM